jgi:hypothetical protein
VGDEIRVNDSGRVLSLKGAREMIRKIDRSKEPTVAQMQAVMENLKEHFGDDLGVRVEVMSYMSGPGYALYFGTLPKDVLLHWNNFDSWPELLTFYRKIMKGAKGK